MRINYGDGAWQGNLTLYITPFARIVAGMDYATQHGEDMQRRIERIFDCMLRGYPTSHCKNYTTPYSETYTSPQGKNYASQRLCDTAWGAYWTSHQEDIQCPIKMILTSTNLTSAISSNYHRMARIFDVLIFDRYSQDGSEG
jgi:hypothetical protein